MIIKIKPSDIDALKYSCAIGEVKCQVFTMEANENLVQVEILNEDNSEISPNMAWYLCGFFETKLAIKEFVNRKI